MLITRFVVLFYPARANDGVTIICGQRTECVSVSIHVCVFVCARARGWDEKERDETTCGNNVSEEILG